MAQITETKVIVRSTDCGPLRRVQPHRFFTYFEQGRLHHLRELGILPNGRQPATRGRTFTIAETRGFFRAPGQYPSNLMVKTWTSDVRNRSFILSYEVVAEDGSFVANGTSAQVWLDAVGRPDFFQESVKEALLGSLIRPTKVDANQDFSAETEIGDVPATETPLSVRYSDLDGDEIVNNSNYFVFFEHGRLRHLRETGAVPKTASARDLASIFHTEETNCHFRVPVRYPEALTVQTKAREVNGNVFAFDYKVSRAGDHYLVAEGSSKHSWLNEAGEPVDVPSKVRLALTQISG